MTNKPELKKMTPKGKLKEVYRKLMWVDKETKQMTSQFNKLKAASAVELNDIVQQARKLVAEIYEHHYGLERGDGIFFLQEEDDDE